MKKQSFIAGTMGAISGFGSGVSGGRQVAATAANLAAPRGDKGKSESIALQAGRLGAIAGTLAGMGYGFKNREKFVARLAKAFGHHPEMQPIYHYLVPAAAGAVGGIAAGAATGGAVGLGARAVRSVQSEKDKTKKYIKAGLLAGATGLTGYGAYRALKGRKGGFTSRFRSSTRSHQPNSSSRPAGAKPDVEAEYRRL